MKINAVDLALLLGRDKPTNQQIKIIEAPSEPAVVIAGAGSGKTTTMTDRVLWLIANQHFSAEEILGLTFTRKAALELATRVRTGLRQLRSHGIEVIGEPTISTYHSFGARILNEHALRAGIEPPSRTLRDASIWQMAYSLVLRYDGDMDGMDHGLTTIVDSVISLSDQMSEHAISGSDIRSFAKDLRDQIHSIPDGDRHGVRAKVREVLQRQERRLKILPMAEELLRLRQSSGEYSFGDQMTLAARVARECPEVGHMERARYASVLLDEYQDTSQSQLSLMRDLFHSHPVMAVGDPLQAIYGWRGASAGTIENFADVFRQSNGEPAHQFQLSTSWRNDQHILDVANTFATSLRIQGIANNQLDPRPGAGEGRVCRGLYETELNAAEGIGDWLLPYWQESQRQRSGGGKGLSIAVLVRKKKEIEAIERALLNRGMAVEVVGVAGLLETPEVADLHAYLRVLFDPTAGDALMRILTGPRWNIGPADIAHLHRIGRSDERERVTLIEALDTLQADARPRSSHVRFSEAGLSRLRSLAAELHSLRSHGGLTLPELITEIERRIGLDIEIGALPGDRSTQARRHVDRFIAEAADFGSAGGGPIAFLSWLKVAAVEERGLALGEVDVSDDAVQLLTIHTAKGLEWDVVVVPGMTSGNFPASGSDDENWLNNYGIVPFPLRGDEHSLPVFNFAAATTQKEVDYIRESFLAELKAYSEREEERLAYVAVTRPRHALLVTATWWQGGKKSRGPSAFFSALPEEITEWIHQDPAPELDATNPSHEIEIQSPWPIDALGERRPEFDAALSLAIAAKPEAPLSDAGRQWLIDAELLLAEKPESETTYLPQRLSVSALVALKSNPDELARRLRRPMPFKPDPLARRGTAFHKWLEERFGSPALLDLDEVDLATSDSFTETDIDLLQKAWLASEWSKRTPVEVEVPFETTIDGILVRGRMDAVYNDDGIWHIVDWKTGGPKKGEELAAVSVQLAVYRLAWAELTNVDVKSIRASFHHVATNETVSPADLLDRDGLIALLRGDDQR